MKLNTQKRIGTENNRYQDKCKSVLQINKQRYIWKTMGNFGNRIDARLVNNEKDYFKCIS